MGIRFLTAGESHGKGLVAILEGFPANLFVTAENINSELIRRQKGYGRGGRMKIEKDQVEIFSGVKKGLTLGSPIAFLIKNMDYENWEKIMTPDPGDIRHMNSLYRPRPGHADLPGGIKYNQHDLRNILERASARETTIRVAAGAVAKKFLSDFGIHVQSHVIQLGPAKVKNQNIPFSRLNKLADRSPVRILQKNVEKKAMHQINRARETGDTLGGVFEIIATGVPIGLGSHVHWDRKLDARLAHSMMSIQAVKGVEIGQGFENAGKFGSEVHDEIAFNKKKGFYHLTNRAGGIEGGISNGEPIVVRVAKKPISTLRRPLRSIDIRSKEKISAAYERSDVCALPAASIIGEAICAWVLADSFLEKFGGDFMEEIHKRYQLYLTHIKRY